MSASDTDPDMAERVAAFDWGATPLGPMEGWPGELKGVVDLMLASPLLSSLICGPERVFLYNDAAAAQYGAHHPGALGRPLPEHWPDAWAGTRAYYERVFAGESVHVPVQPLDLEEPGSGQAFEAYLTPVRDASGAVIAAHMTGFEVGARHRAEAALKESEARFRAFVTASSDVVYRMSPDWREMRYLDGRGFVADTAGPSRGWLDSYIHPDDQSAVRAAIDRAVAAGSKFELEHRVIRIDGTLGWTQSRAVPIPGKDGEITEWLGAASDVTARREAEEALARSEERYRTLFATMEDAFCVIEMIFDEEGRPVDFVYLETNPSFEKHATRPMLGRRIRDIVPDFEQFWIDQYGHVARTGEPVRLEHVVEGLGDQWFATSAVRLGGEGSRLVAVLFTNITERKRAEAALRESEERQAFLLKLSDALRPLADALKIEETACRLLAERLGVDRAYFVDVDEAAGTARVGRDYARDGARSLVGEHRVSDFQWSVDILRRGESHVVANTQESELVPEADRAVCAALDIIACTGAPLIKGGLLHGALCVTAARPREWTAVEVDLLREVGERIWAAVERARAEAALAESEQLLRRFGEASTDVLWIRDARMLRWEYLTRAFEEIYGVSREEALRGNDFRSWVDLIVPEDRAHAIGAIRRVREGEEVTFDYRIRRPADGEVRWLRNTDFPILDDAGQVVRIGGSGKDVTAEREAADAVRESEHRLLVLTEGIPQLVWRSCDMGRWTWSSPQWRAFTGQTQEESRGEGWLDVVHPDDREATMRAWEAARPNGLLDVEYRVRRASDGAWLWHHTRSLPVRDAEGRIVEWLGTTTDIDELRRLQERQAVLVEELQHRTRNLMAVVRSVSDRTMRGAGDLEAFAASFGERMSALARVQGLLSRLHEGDRVTFDDLIRSELDALGAGDGKVELDGPNGVRLRSGTVQMIAMGLHELATNAVKYGALGQAGGRLTVRWRLEDGARERRWLHVDWVESGVAMPPPGDRPRGGGQGRELIERALPYQMGAKTRLEMGADGVRCELTLPVSER